MGLFYRVIRERRWLQRFRVRILVAGLNDLLALGVIDVNLACLLAAASFVRAVAERQVLAQAASADEDRLARWQCGRVDLVRPGRGVTNQSCHGVELENCVDRASGFDLRGLASARVLPEVGSLPGRLRESHDSANPRCLQAASQRGWTRVQAACWAHTGARACESP